MTPAPSPRRLSATAVLTALLVSPAAGVVHAAPGDPLGDQFQVNTYTTSNQIRPSIAALGPTGFVVVWESDESSTDFDDTVQGQRYDATGTPIGGQFQVNSYTTSYQRLPAVGPHREGFVWESYGSHGSDSSERSIHGQRYDRSGVPIGDEFQVNTTTDGPQRRPAVAGDDAGGFVVAWESYRSAGTDTSGYSIQAQRYDSDGQPISGEFQVNSVTTFDQRNPAVALTSDGGFVVVWEGFGGGTILNYTIRAQVYDATGAAMGNELQVPTSTMAYQQQPAVVGGAAGGFVVAWKSDASSGTDVSGYSIQARVFERPGSPLGPEFQVNTITTGTQFAPAITSAGATGFVVAWGTYEYPEDGPGYTFGVRGQMLDGLGSLVGDEFSANTVSPASQPAVAATDKGDFAVAWTGGSADTDDSYWSIQARRFAGAGAAGETLTGRKLVLASKRTSKLVMVSKDRTLTLGRGNGSADDPVLHGARLTLASKVSGETFGSAHDLVGSWRYIGRMGQDKGYNWKSKASPIRTVAIKNGKVVKIVGKGLELGLDLGTDPNPVQIQLQIGSHSHCFEFGGEKARFKATNIFRAKQAPAPLSCS